MDKNFPHYISNNIYVYLPINIPFGLFVPTIHLTPYIYFVLKIFIYWLLYLVQFYNYIIICKSSIIQYFYFEQRFIKM